VKSLGSKVLVLAAAAVVLLGSACGGDDEGDGESTTAGSKTGAAATGEPIRIGYSAWPGWFPWAVTEEAGIFEDVGVNVEMVWFEGYLDSINAFAAGQLDGNTQTLNDTIASVAAGSEQVIVLVNDNSTGNDQIIVTADIKTIQDLRGKEVGVEVGVVDHFLLLLGLESVGMTAADLEIVPIETGAAAASFAAGRLDGVGVFAPFTTQALEREGAHTLFTSKDHPGAIPDHLVLSKELIDARPDDVQKIVEAWFRTLEYIEDHRADALKVMSERAGVTVQEYESYDAGTTIFSVEDNLKAFGPGTTFASLQFAAGEISTFLLESEFIEAKPNLAGLFEPRFVQKYAESR
jgi:NitT/TauT family transport system substrate-binding protein